MKLSSGTASAPFAAVSTQFHENCDSAVKIDFLMIECSRPLVRAQFWSPSSDFMRKCDFYGRKIAIFIKLGAELGAPLVSKLRS